MILTLHLNKTRFVSVLCVLMFCSGLTFIYPLFERSISDGNRPVMAELHDHASTVTNTKSKLNENMHVMDNLQGRDSTVTNARPELIGSDKMKTLVWYDTAVRRMIGLFSRVGFSQCSKYKNCQYKRFITRTDSYPNKPFDADAILI